MTGGFYLGSDGESMSMPLCLHDIKNNIYDRFADFHKHVHWCGEPRVM